MKKLLVLACWFVLVAVCSASAQEKQPTKTIQGGVLNGKAKSLPVPAFPEDARRARVGGTVKVEVLIDESGKVASARTVSGPDHASLRAASEEAAMRAEFSPTLLDGAPVKVSGVITYNFNLPPSYTEQLKFMGMSTMLALIRSYAAAGLEYPPSDTSRTMATLKAVTADFPQYSDEFYRLAAIDTAPVADRPRAIDDGISALRKKMNDAERWQVDIGTNFGGVMGSIAAGSKRSGGAAFVDFDWAELRLRLEKIKELIQSAPPDTPEPVLNKLRNLAALADSKDLSTPENIRELRNRSWFVVTTVDPQ